MPAFATFPRLMVAACFAIAISSGAMVACGSSSPPTASDSASSSTSTTAKGEDFEAQADDFTNIHDMTAVRGFFVDNKLGHLDEAVAMAEANKGGTYPVGTILQLVPQEAMVKRHPGWNAATKDWEFFFLDVSKDGTKILDRGADQVTNRFGNSCASCHETAEEKFDMVCETNHGCEPLPIRRPVIDDIQEADPRPLQG